MLSSETRASDLGSIRHVRRPVYSLGGGRDTLDKLCTAKHKAVSAHNHYTDYLGLSLRIQYVKPQGILHQLVTELHEHMGPLYCVCDHEPLLPA